MNHFLENCLGLRYFIFKLNSRNKKKREKMSSTSGIQIRDFSTVHDPTIDIEYILLEVDAFIKVFSNAKPVGIKVFPNAKAVGKDTWRGSWLTMGKTRVFAYNTEINYDDL